MLTITRTTKKAEKAGDPDDVVATYTADGKTLDEDNFKKFYQAVIGLQVEGEVSRTVSEQPEVSVTYTLNKGADEDACGWTTPPMTATSMPSSSTA